jgi:trehalose synthase
VRIALSIRSPSRYGSAGRRQQAHEGAELEDRSSQPGKRSLMAEPTFVQLDPQPLERYRGVLDGDFDHIRKVADFAADAFEGRTIWHVNSTYLGGGVAEMLRSFLPYANDAGVDTRWVVLSERPEFFGITKRIHNKLHGHPGDGGSLGSEERAAYEEILEDSSHHLTDLIRPNDVVFLHDPQTAGLIPAVQDAGAVTIWRCHVGIEISNEHVHEAIDFLVPYVEQADGFVFSRGAYLWPQLPADRAHLMAPAIDAFSPKNQELDDGVVSDILGIIGFSGGHPGRPAPFMRSDGTPGQVERPAEILQVEPLPADAPLVAQISRWDVLKDHEGLLECFSTYLADSDAHLALVGPSSGAVADDPEGPAMQQRIADAWQALPDDLKRRVHIVNLAMDDFDENGAMVNAIQRRCDIVVQKSLVEGFGLTVSEAMWKSKPVVGSAVGGIKDQIVDGETGILVEDPADLESFGAALRRLLDDPALARSMGEASRARVAKRFLAAPRIAEYVSLIGLVEANQVR